ncbi:phosphomannomutase/phosphoglucomutase [Candidatus Uhrbacteria bacterium]|nr:phosphomannomutase/phosphoglucomutase [Candidatus Uhrbacteria bacterium]
MNASIFKAYDIRGLSPGELGAAEAGRIGVSLAKLHRPKKVVVGHDMRLTSTELEQTLIDGLNSQGVDVVRIGLCTTPMFNFAVAESNGGYDMGIMVTASHNPARYNGLKITKGDNTSIGQGSGMEELRDLACGGEPIPQSNTRGAVSDDEGLLERYVEAIWSRSKLEGGLSNWKISIDAGNGMEGIVLPKLSKKIGADVQELYWKLDGNFPNHEANPVKVETLGDLQDEVKSKGCAFGAAFDGDGDRVGFVDEHGEAIPGDILTALFAKAILAEQRGATVLYDLRSSKSVKEVIEEAGGKAEMCKVGHAGIKRQMRETGAVFAGELSMHFYFSEFANCEASDYAMLLLIRLMLREGKPLSEIWKPLVRYSHSGEINFEVKDTKAALALVEERYSTGSVEVSHLDGVRIDRGDWWFSLRASNTEPLIRLNLEANDAATMKSKVEEIRVCLASLIQA